MLGAEASGDAVVQDHAVLGAHDAIADFSNVQVRPLVDVEQVQQLRHVRAAQVELAQRGYVDDADVLADVADFGVGISVVVGTDPGSRHQRLRPILFVPGLHGRVPHRLEVAPGQGAERDRGVGRPPGRRPRLFDGLSGRLRDDRHCIHGLQLALRRSHRGGRVTLRQLGGVVALLHRRDQVLGRHVFRIVHETVRPAAE